MKTTAAATPPPELEVRVRVDASGLHGGPDVELMPHLGLYASMRDHRVQVLHPIVADRDIVTVLRPPPASQTRGDEMLHGDQFTFSRDSFQADINKVEHDHVLRTLQSGHFEIPLRELAQAAVDGQTRAVPITDRILGGQIASHLRAERGKAGLGGDEAILAEVDRRATKGMAYLTVRALGKNAAAGVAQFARALAHRAETAPYLLYASPRYYEAMDRSMALTLDHFSEHFFAGAGGAGSPPLHPLNPNTPSGDNLFLVQYKSNFGTLPVAGFFMARPPDDHLVPDTEPAHERPDALTADSAAYYDRSLMAALGRKGRSLAWARGAMRAQLKQAASDPAVSVDWLDGKEIVADAATFVANELNYTSDVSFENPHAHDTHTALVLPEAAAVAKRVRLAAHHAAAQRRRGPRRGPLGPPPHQRLCRLRARTYQGQHAELFAAEGGGGGSGGGTGGDAKSAVTPDAVSIERFDKAPVQGASNSGDCEDQSFVAMAVYEDMRECAQRFTDATRFPALAAFREMLDMHCVFAAASTVSSAMYNAEGKEVTREDLVKNGLPLKGSAEDRATTAKDGGHCTVILTPTAITAAQLARAGVDVATEAPGLLGGRRPAQWEYEQGTQLLEGTGPVDSWVIPTAEVSEALAQHGLARRAVLRAMRDQTPTLTSVFKIKAPGFTETRRPLEQRVSPFYHDVFFLQSPRLYAENPTLGLFGVCETTGMTRGVEFGDLLRDKGRTIALVSPFRQLGATAWRADVQPVLACALNQMAATTLGRFASPPSLSTTTLASSSEDDELAQRLQSMARPVRDVGLSRLGTVLPDEVVAGFARFATQPPWALAGALDAHSRGMQRRFLGEPANASVPSRSVAAATPTPATTTLCLYTQPWRLQGVAMTTLLSEIAALKAQGLVTGHQFLRDRPLAQCDDVVTLRLTVPVAAAST